MASILLILKRIPIFKTFQEKDYETIINNIRLQYFPEKYIIFSKGDEGDCMYIIKSGKVRIVHENEGGEKIIALLKDNDFFGEMALFSDEVRNATAKTNTDCELFTLSKKDFCNLLVKDQNMADKISNEFVRRLKENNGREM